MLNIYKTQPSSSIKSNSSSGSTTGFGKLFKKRGKVDTAHTYI